MSITDPFAGKPPYRDDETPLPFVPSIEKQLLAERRAQIAQLGRPIKHPGLPVAGYTAQDPAKIAAVNVNKELEERVLRQIDKLKLDQEGLEPDQCLIAIAHTHMQIAFMVLNRAIFKPERIKLPEDGQ
ncbi:DUF7681 family protein [Ancylobacter rudongensis]|uniref:Acb2/Tad1 hairpin domain-containing protein n=1 Tax=Ancylobacter rudongensis TaxID=177413 RepID=A0A1G4UPG4_9HYPH|nr:hypothetical protein [Ancylobacter rudongensis]SCW95532.1 hypothetical protein SAMN05660859_0049 [Ancylobacter rudongensis]